MEVVNARCAGLDVHKKVIVACGLTPEVVDAATGQPAPQLARFGAMTEDLVALAGWLVERGITTVAMESTGVYWQPVWNILEEAGGFALLLVNAQHIKAVPGRKTDVKDAQWLAELLRHGLVRASFVPDRAQRELRELTRYRTALIEERTAHVNRLQKTLESANIKLAAVASNVTGVSARAMLAQLVAGVDDPAGLAGLAKGRLRDKLPALERALTGRFGDHHRYLVPRILAAIDFLDAEIVDLDARIAECERPFAEAVERLDTIPGVGRRVAEVVIAEVGASVTRFPTAQHLASWAGLCPGNYESAGKRLGGTPRRGNLALRRALVQAAHAAGRARRTYLGAQYGRLAGRRGKKKAAVAVAHSILVIAYHLLARQTAYADLGPDYFDRRDTAATERRLIKRLEQLGNKVTVEKVA
jgi:transposase